MMQMKNINDDYKVNNEKTTTIKYFQYITKINRKQGK